MVAMFKEFIFDFTDLKLSITCANCNTEIIIDVSRPLLELPKKCGPCKHLFDEEFYEAIDRFCSAYKVFSDKKTERAFTARIRTHSELKMEI